MSSLQKGITEMVRADATRTKTKWRISPLEGSLWYGHDVPRAKMLCIFIVLLPQTKKKRLLWGQDGYYQNHIDIAIVGGGVVYHHKNYGTQAGGAA